MRERDVPQEGNATLGGHRKAVYAVGEDGKLRIIASRGWQVEEIVTRQALAELEASASEARRRAFAGLPARWCAALTAGSTWACASRPSARARPAWRGSTRSSARVRPSACRLRSTGCPTYRPTCAFTSTPTT